MSLYVARDRSILTEHALLFRDYGPEIPEDLVELEHASLYILDLTLSLLDDLLLVVELRVRYEIRLYELLLLLLLHRTLATRGLEIVRTLGMAVLGV